MVDKEDRGRLHIMLDYHGVASISTPASEYQIILRRMPTFLSAKAFMQDRDDSKPERKVVCKVSLPKGRALTFKM